MKQRPTGLRLPRGAAPLAACLALAAVVAGPVSAQIQNTIENFKATLQRHPNGRVRTILEADHAEFPTEKTVVGENVTIRMYTPQGELEAQLASDHVEIDQESKVGKCPNHAEFDRSGADGTGIHISGSDVEWRGDDSLIIINANARIDLFRGDKPLIQGWK